MKFLSTIAAVIAIAVIVAVATSSTFVSAACGVIQFPNGSKVDLTSFTGRFEGKVSQTGTYPGDYTWQFSPCVAICGGSSYLSQESGGDDCSVVVSGMTMAPSADGTIIRAKYGPTQDTATGLSWGAHVRMLCGPNAALTVVGNEYLADVVGTAVTTHWTVMSSAFCAPQGPPPAPPGPVCTDLKLPNGQTVPLKSFSGYFYGSMLGNVIAENGTVSAGVKMFAEVSPCGSFAANCKQTQATSFFVAAASYSAGPPPPLCDVFATHDVVPAFVDSRGGIRVVYSGTNYGTGGNGIPVKTLTTLHLQCNATVSPTQIAATGFDLVKLGGNERTQLFDVYLSSSAFCGSAN